MIKSVVNCVSGGGYLTAPNGIYLSSNPTTYGDGNIFYENGEFYCGYKGTIKAMPKKSNFALPKANAQSFESVNVILNEIIDALVQAQIITKE